MEDHKNELSKPPVILGPVITKTSQYVEKSSDIYRLDKLRPYDNLLSTFLFETSMKRCPKCSHYAHNYFGGERLVCDFCKTEFCPHCYETVPEGKHYFRGTHMC